METLLAAAPRRTLRTGVWAFVIADSFTFAALLAVYGYLRAGADSWPRPFTTATVAYGFTMTALLASSGVAMARAVAATRRQDSSGARRSIGVTIALGLAFVALHLGEWRSLALHATFPDPLFPATFFSITGFHMLHVLAGLVALALLSIRGRSESIEAVAIYWQFVDVVWLVIFPALYLTAVA